MTMADIGGRWWVVISFLLFSLLVVDQVRHYQCSPLLSVSFCSSETRSKVSNGSNGVVVR